MTRRAGLMCVCWATVAAAQSANVAAPAPLFVDVTERTGIQFTCHTSKTARKYLLETMVGGVAMLDYDGDGSLDLFFVNGAALSDPMPAGKEPDKSERIYWNRLYRNKGDGTFIDVTEKAGVRGHGYGMGVAAADYDNDGHPDLYVTNYGSNILYHNNGDGTFTDVTGRAGVAAGGWSAGAAFLDYDRDGLLDLFVARYLTWDFSMDKWCGERRPERRSYCHPDQFQPITHVLFRNEGDGKFRDVSKQAGIADAPGKGLGVAIHDMDSDGWPDIVVANDSFPQQLFRNNGKVKFTETGLHSGIAFDEDGRPFAGMGIDVADYDNNGRPDVFVNALANQRYALFRAAGGGFEYVSGSSGVGRITMTHSGWGAKFLDYDNDGWKDLLVGQGHVMDNIELTQPNLRYLEPMLLMRNVRGKFEDVSSQAGQSFLTARAARGVAFGDLNNDGFVDFAVNSNNQKAAVFQNRGANGHHWLLIRLVGRRSNRDGIGARLRLVSASGLEQHAFVTTASSYLSANDPRVHFGLGAGTSARLLEVVWPSGTVQRLENVQTGQILTVREPD